MGLEGQFMGFMTDGQWVNGRLVGAKFQQKPPQSFFDKFEKMLCEFYGVEKVKGIETEKNE